MGEGLDRRPAVAVAPEDGSGQREQLPASPIKVATTAEPPGAEVARLTGRTLVHARSVGQASRSVRVQGAFGLRLPKLEHMAQTAEWESQPAARTLGA